MRTSIKTLLPVEGDLGYVAGQMTTLFQAGGHHHECA